MRKKRIQKAMTLFVVTACMLISVNAFAGMTCKAIIPVNCDLGGTVKIEAKGGAPEPVSDTLRLEDKETGFFEIAYDVPGNYTYEVREVKGSEKNVTYDDTVYNVSVFVSADDNGLEPVVVVSRNDEKNDSVRFENKIDTPEKDNRTLSPEPSVMEKKGEGNTSAISRLKGVKTGDDFNTGFLHVAAGCAIVLFFALRRRKDGRVNNETK